jgi:predicted DNA-binding transcriptional regulator AlpA
MNPETRYLRIWQIVGDVKRGIPAIIPISKSAWWAGVKSGRYPKQVKLSQRCSGWKLEDVMAVCSQFKAV